jgi:Uma2 family endonuclease
MTASQFLMLGEDPAEIRRELVHGEIVVIPGASYAHGYVVTMLAAILGGHIIENDLGELVGHIDTIFGELDVRRPDIIFTAKSQLHLLDPNRHGIHYAPDLLVEVISPGNESMDRVDKFKLYATHGVKHYWLVDPDAKSFIACQLSGDRYLEAASAHGNDTIKAPPFPDLEISLARLWPPRRQSS